MQLKLIKNYNPLKNSAAVSSKHDYLIEAAKISKSGLYTKNINACIAGLISNGKLNMMFHLAPELQGLKSLEKIFNQKIDKFCSDKNSNKVEAIICGGWNSSSKDKTTAELSIALYNKIAELLEAWGANLSILCGKKQNELDSLFIENGKTIISSEAWNKSGIDLNKLKTASQKEIIKALENRFETVEIHPDLEIIV